MAPVDIETGRVGKAVLGGGLEREEVGRHPDSGAPIAGFTIPLWAEAKQLCLKAAELFPDGRFQAWDLAICEDGPKLQEINSNGNYKNWQNISGRGMLNEEMRALLTARNRFWRLVVIGSVLWRVVQVVRHRVRGRLRTARRAA